MARIAVFGGGYVGLVSSAGLAELGHEVTCIEIDPTRLKALRLGGDALPLFEPGLDHLVASEVRSGRLTFTGECPIPLSEAEFAFIAVNTPPRADGSADTQFVERCLESIADYGCRNQTVVIKSTVPVGTADDLEATLEAAGRLDVRIVSNPEFLREGSAVIDFRRPDRVVIGAADATASDSVAGLYAGLNAKIVKCSRRSAELAKYAANAMLATRISFINELAAICEVVRGDIEEVAEIMKLDPRIGPHFLRAGLGWGGSCFPKDVKALTAIGRSAGVHTPITTAAYDINQQQRDRAYFKIRRELADQPDPVVGVLGLAFKPDTDDLREAPSLDIITRLLADGVQIRAHDPVAMNSARRLLPSVLYQDEPSDVACGADLLFLATEWPVYKELEWFTISRLMRGTTVLDGRHVLDPLELQRHGLTYVSFGRDDGTRAAASVATALVPA